MPAGSVPEDVPDSINTLFSEYLYKAEDALALNLFEDFEMWRVVFNPVSYLFS